MTIKKSRNHKRIFDVNGKLLFEGKAKSIKALVERCAKSGHSLSGADLRGFDLMHLNLANIDFSNACLDGTQFNGSILRGANFSSASMRAVSAPGVAAEYADFSDVDFSPMTLHRAKSDLSFGHDGERIMTDQKVCSSFVGAMLTFAKFDRSKQLEVDFSCAGMSSSSHIGAVCKKSSYNKSLLLNADWSDASVISNSFDNAQLSPRMNVNPVHLPARTKNALIVGNTYDGTEIGAGNYGFHVDNIVGSKIRLATLGLVTSGLFLGTALIPFDIENTLTSTVGTTATFVIAASAIAWIKTPFEDFLTDTATEYLAGLAIKIRSGISELCKRGKALGSLSVALMSSKHANFLQKCLLARHDTLYMRIKAAAKGEYDVIVCDRERLAEALARMSEVLSSKSGRNSSIVLVRSTGKAGSQTIPRAVVLNGDGGVEALWDEDKNGDIKRLSWDAAKIPIPSASSGDMESVVGPFNSHAPVIRKFIRSVLDDHELENFSFSHHTHLIRQGLDKSIVVVRAKDGRLDNSRGPAIVTPGNDALYFKNSVAYDKTGKKRVNKSDCANVEVLNPSP